MTSECNGMRPGFARLNFTFFMSEEMFNYVLDCIEFIVEEGYKFLPFYLLNVETGEWTHKDKEEFKGMKSLSNINYKDGVMGFKDKHKDLVESTLDYTSYLEEAKKIVMNNVEMIQKKQFFPETKILEKSELRWFVLPHEVFNEVLNQFEKEDKCVYSLTNCPFRTSNLLGKLGISDSTNPEKQDCGSKKRFNIVN